MNKVSLIKIKSLDNEILYFPKNILINKCLTIFELFEEDLNNDSNKNANNNFILDLNYTSIQIINFLSFIESETIHHINEFDDLHEFEDYLKSLFDISNFLEYDNHSSIYTNKSKLINNTMEYIINMNEKLNMYSNYKQIIPLYNYLNSFDDVDLDLNNILELLKIYIINSKKNKENDILWGDLLNLLNIRYDNKFDINIFNTIFELLNNNKNIDLSNLNNLKYNIDSDNINDMKNIYDNINYNDKDSIINAGKQLLDENIMEIINEDNDEIINEYNDELYQIFHINNNNDENIIDTDNEIFDENNAYTFYD